MIHQRRTDVSYAFTTHMADVINQFTHQQHDALEEQKTKYHKYIKRLRNDLDVKSEVVAKQASQIAAQTDDIRDLGASNEQLTSQLHDLTAKLSHSRKMDEKYELCKAHLNKALLEQQDLYTRSKKQQEDALEEIRAMEKSQSAKAEEVVRNAEMIRAAMMEKVRQAVAQNKSEAVECECCDPRATHKAVEADTPTSVRQNRGPHTTGRAEGH